MPQQGYSIVLQGPASAERAAGFAKRLQEILPRMTTEAASIVQRRLALKFLDSVNKGTPVDTGRAKGNWQLGIDQVPLGETGRNDKSGNATKAKATQNLGALRGTKRFHAVYITNNVPYIEVLERGFYRGRNGRLVRWSRRNNGFFARAIAEVEAELAGK
jgi:hypothetical protein